MTRLRCIAFDGETGNDIGLYSMELARQGRDSMSGLDEVRLHQMSRKSSNDSMIQLETEIKLHVDHKPHAPLFIYIYIKYAMCLVDEVLGVDRTSRAMPSAW
jgi:hypothetical protein